LAEKGRKMDLRSFLGASRPRSLRFSEFIDAFMSAHLPGVQPTSTII